MDMNPDKLTGVRAKIDKILWVLLCAGAAWICYEVYATPGSMWFFR